MLGSSKPISQTDMEKLAEIARISDSLKRHRNALSSFAWQTGLSYLSSALTQFMISLWVQNSAAGSSMFHALERMKNSDAALTRDLKNIQSQTTNNLAGYIAHFKAPLHDGKRLNMAREFFLGIENVLEELTLGLWPKDLFASWMPPANISCDMTPIIDCDAIVRNFYCVAEFDAIQAALNKGIPIEHILLQGAVEKTRNACPTMTVTAEMLSNPSQLKNTISTLKKSFPSVGTSTSASRAIRTLTRYLRLTHAPATNTTDPGNQLQSLADSTVALPAIDGPVFGNAAFRESMRNFRDLIADLLSNQKSNMYQSRIACYAEMACVSIYIGIAIKVLKPLLKGFDIATGVFYGLIGLFCQLVVMPVFAMAITAAAPKIIKPNDNPPEIKSENPTSDEINNTHEKLKQLESESWPWEHYINLLLALLLPLLIFLFIVSFKDEDNQYPSPGSILTAVGPILGNIVKAVTGQTHQAFIRLYGIPYYSELTQEWLKKALLLNSKNLLENTFELSAAKLENSKALSWEQIQLVLAKKNSIAITRTQVEEKLLAVSELLNAYKISYYLVARGREYALYINAASAYQTLRTSLGNEGIVIKKLGDELKIALTRLELIQQVKEILERLTQQNIVHQYWLDDTERRKICYDLLINAEKDTAIQSVFHTYINAENRLSLPIDKLVVSQLMGTPIATSHPTAHSASAHVIPSTSQTRQRTPGTTKKEPTINKTEPAVPATKEVKTYTWIVNEKTFSYPENRNILMVWGTQNNQNPCFILNELTREMFSSDFAYKRVCGLLENPKLATSATAQQGLVFFTDKQGNKRIKAKPYGSVMGVGDLRPYSDPALSSGGAELYRISHLGNHRDIELV